MEPTRADAALEDLIGRLGRREVLDTLEALDHGADELRAFTRDVRARLDVATRG